MLMYTKPIIFKRNHHRFRQSLSFLFLVMMLSVSLGVKAQVNAISVEKFDYNPNDQTAITYPEKDPQSHRNCALVIFNNVEVGDYQFSVNGWSKRVDKTSKGKKVIWLYVYPGCKRITIANPAVTDKTLDYNCGRTLESGKTYIITLGNVFLPTNQKQYLTFVLNPPTASIEVNGEPWTVTNGTAQESVKLGRYEIKAVCQDYHTYRDVVEFTDASKPMTVKVNLKPAFGYLDIDGGSDVADGEVFVDAVRKGTGNVKQVRLPSGTYTVKITKRLYKTYEGKVTITDGETSVLKPVMTPDFSVTTLTTTSDAEIWLDDKLLGYGQWKGPLEIGEYVIHVRKAGHEPRSQQIKIESITTPHEFTLPSPVPIYGEIDVTSTPSGATIKLDGQPVASTTPYHINNVIIGDHTVSVEKDGYQTYTQKVSVTKGQTSNVVAKLSNIINLKVYVTPASASVTANGRTLGGTMPYTVSGRVGSSVNLSAYASGYHSKNITETFDRNGRNISIVLKERGPEYYAPRGVYLDMGGSLLGLMGVNGNLGWYVGHSGFNIEAEWMMSFSGNEICWTSIHDGGHSFYMDYTPMAYGGKIGYGISLYRSQELEYQEGLGRGCVLTPQVGLRLVSFSCSRSTYCMSATLGLRFEWRTASHFGFFFVPEYQFGVSKGDIYEVISDFNKDIKKNAEGFNFRLGFSIIFGSK